MDFGEFEIFPVSDGTFRLDGGAMFGVVPRTLWEVSNPPDEKNRVLLGLNPLLIKAGGEKILVETGIGGKGDEKFRSIYGIERNPGLGGSLRKIGLIEEDVSIVINTHLHFDHAGGNTLAGAGGALRPAFPRARYIVQRGEFEKAMSPNERERASYRAEDFVPVKEAGLFELIDGDREITKGVSVFRAPGHNRDIQLVKIESGGRTAVVLSDIIPTAAHLKYPWIAGYDLFPLETLRIKKEIVEKAAAGGWLLFFFHDPQVKAGHVRLEDGGPVVEKVL